jgi:hypothetical protein
VHSDMGFQVEVHRKALSTVWTLKRLLPRMH